MRKLTITIDYPESPCDEDQIVDLFKTMASYIEGWHVSFEDKFINEKQDVEEGED